MKNKKCIIIYGCPSNKEKAMDENTRSYDKHWIPWVKKELQEKEIEIVTPLMPNPWEPVYEDFKKEFEKYDVSEETVLVGHSCACAFLVRWLGETDKKIDKLILVAPWKIATKEKNFRDKFYNYSINKDIKDRVKEIVMFTANDENINGKRSLKMYHDVLGGKIFELESHGHYTMNDMGTEEFPELIDIIIS